MQGLFKTGVKLAVYVWIFCVSAEIKAATTTLIKTEIHHPAALTILPPTLTLTELAAGFKWAEGPVWLAQHNFLLFSDIPNNRVMKFNPATNKVSIYLNNSGYTGEYADGYQGGSNGLLLAHDNHLVLFQHGDRRIVKMHSPIDQPQAKYITLTDNYQGKRLNSPNDGVFNQSGDLYFTDPPYGLVKNRDDPRKQLPFQGLFLLRQSGELVLLTEEINFPNGVALSNDEDTLYVSVSDPDDPHWLAFDIAKDGTVFNKRVLMRIPKNEEKSLGLPDGMAVHSSGVLFATGPGGLWVFNQNEKLLAHVPITDKITNCVFSEDEKTLYLTAPSKLLSINLMKLNLKIH